MWDCEEVHRDKKYFTFPWRCTEYALLSVVLSDVSLYGVGRKNEFIQNIWKEKGMGFINVCTYFELAWKNTFFKIFSFCSYDMATIATFCPLDKNLCAWQGFAHQYIINRIDIFRMPVRLMGLQFCISELTLTLLYELMKCQFHVFSSSGIPNTWLGHHRSRGAYLQAEVSKRGVVCYYSTSGGSGGWVIGSDKEDNLDKNCTAELLRLRNYILAIAIFLFVSIEHSFSYTFSRSKILFSTLFDDLLRLPLCIILSFLLCLFITPKLG